MERGDIAGVAAGRGLRSAPVPAEMSRSFLVDSLIGDSPRPSYPLPYYAGQLPNYMFNFFNLGIGAYHQQLHRPLPRQPLPVLPPVNLGLPSPPSEHTTSRVSGEDEVQCARGAVRGKRGVEG